MEAPIFIGELELNEPIVDIALPTRADGLGYNGVRLLRQDAALSGGIRTPSW